MKKEDITVRLADKEDISAMYRVEKKTFANPWAYESFAENVRHGLTVYFLAELEGEVVGFGGMMIVVDEAHVMNIAVLEQHRRQGIGRALVQALANEAQRRGAVAVFLEVRIGNTAAKTLYEDEGFQEIAIRKQYYTDNLEDAVIMRLNLSNFSA